jgi:hypothetical protein
MNFDSVTTNHNELELSDAELETVYGGTDGNSSSHGERIHSYSVICDISLFSINVNVLNIISIATSQTQVCINND